MAKERIETGKAAFIEVANCDGDLLIRPWMELAVEASGNFELTEADGRWVFQAAGDLHLLVPVESNLKIDRVKGDFLIRSIHGDVELGEAFGDVVLQNLLNVSIKTVRGDMLAKNIANPLIVETVYGDMLARNIAGHLNVDGIYGDIAAYYINGDVRLGQCKGDINVNTVNGQVVIDYGYRDANLRNLGGSCTIKEIRGDIRLKGGLSSGEHRFRALGDIVVRWPVNAPLQLVANAPDIRNRLPLKDIKETDNRLIGRIGDGDTVVTLTAEGRISLKEGKMIDEKWESDQKDAFDMDFMADFSDLGERISAEVSRSMANLTQDLENSFGPEFAQDISAKVAQQAEKAARKAEAAAEKARRYAEREVMHAQRYAPWTSQTPPGKQPRKADASTTGASSEEQLKILRMVEKGTITPDEAATLLEALD